MSDYYEASQRSLAAPPAQHQVYSAVGQVAAEWARLEHELDLIIWELAGIEPAKGACMTAQMMGHSPRCQAIIALGTLHNFSIATVRAVETLRNKLFDVSDPRNRIIHDPWYVDLETQQTAQFKSMPKKDLRFGIAPIEQSEIEATLGKIRNRLSDCTALRKTILTELQSLRGKQP